MFIIDNLSVEKQGKKEDWSLVWRLRSDKFDTREEKMETGAEALFQGDIDVPEALGPILKDLTKEILRKGLNEKKDILEFSKDYFISLCKTIE